MTMRRWLPLLLVLLAPGLLSACGGRSIQESFGLGKRAPDEFQVVRRAPLVMPPEYNLRPPEPGAEGPATRSASTDAYAALTGQEPPVDRSMSSAEVELVQATPGQVMPNIRQVIAQEDPLLTVLDRGSFLFLLSWQKPRYAANLDVLNPNAEADRLRSQGIVTTTRTKTVPFPQ
jgi:hypothetical protein